MRQIAPISFFEIFILVVFFLASVVAMLATLIIVLHKRKPNVVRFESIHITELIKLVISVASFVTVCITLILLVLQNRVIVAQTKYASESVESSVFGTITGQNLLCDGIFNAAPELRPYFYLGKDIQENDPLNHKVYAVAEHLLDFYDSLATQLKKYPSLWKSEKDAWEKNIIDMFAWSPVLCRYLEVNKEWYDDYLVPLKLAGEKKRREGNVRQKCDSPTPAQP